MSFESVTQARPGGVDALVEQGFFDRGQQVVGQQTKKNVGVGAPLFVVEDWPDDERRFHVAEGILGAREQSVDAPDLIGGEVFAIGLEQITAVELFGSMMFVGIARGNERCGFLVVGERMVASHAGIALA